MKIRIKKWKLLTIAAVMVLGMACMTMTAFAKADGSDTGEVAETFTDTSQETVIEEQGSLPERVQVQPDNTETPFSVPGNGQLVDDVDNDSTKQFLTIQTKNGNTFFLVVDRSNNTDNVYMLSMVDENDLAEFTEKTEDEETAPSLILPEKEPEPEPAVEETEPEAEPEKEEPEKGNTGILLVVFLLAAAGIGAYLYFKVIKPGKEEENGEDESLEFYDGGEYINEDIPNSGRDDPDEDEE